MADQLALLVSPSLARACGPAIHAPTSLPLTRMSAQPTTGFTPDRAASAAGYLRDYAAVLPVMSHAYNFQANAYGFTDTTRKADNQASRADVAVDPTLQVLNDCC